MQPQNFDPDKISENWTTIDKGSSGFIGFCDRSKQSADFRVLQLWLTLHPMAEKAEKYIPPITKLFNNIVWDGTGAIITIQLSEPLKSPSKFLRNYADLISHAIFELDSEEFREQFLEMMDEEEDEEEPYEPVRVWFTEGPCGHNGYE